MSDALALWPSFQLNSSSRTSDKCIKWLDDVFGECCHDLLIYGQNWTVSFSTYQYNSVHAHRCPISIMDQPQPDFSNRVERCEGRRDVSGKIERYHVHSFSTKRNNIYCKRLCMNFFQVPLDLTFQPEIPAAEYQQRYVGISITITGKITTTGGSY